MYRAGRKRQLLSHYGWTHAFVAGGWGPLEANTAAVKGYCDAIRSF